MPVTCTFPNTSKPAEFQLFQALAKFECPTEGGGLTTLPRGLVRYGQFADANVGPCYSLSTEEAHWFASENTDPELPRGRHSKAVSERLKQVLMFSAASSDKRPKWKG